MVLRRALQTVTKYWAELLVRVIELLEKINDRDPEIVFDTAEGIKAMREREARNGVVFT